ncbi:unnamed protein product [Closterium sp. NIES-53]
MVRDRLVSGLLELLTPLPRSPAPLCTPCVEGRQCAARHSSFPPTITPLQTLHLDVWGPSPVLGPRQVCYFLIVVDDYSRYTTVFTLRRKADVPTVLEPWLLARGGAQGLRGLRLHSDRGGEFSSTCLETFCQGQRIIQSYTLPDSPQQNGVAEQCIGLVMEVARTSMCHADAPRFLWPQAVRYATHQLNLRPSDTRPRVTPVSLWTGSPGVAANFQVWGSLAHVRAPGANKLSLRTCACVFLGFALDASSWVFYDPVTYQFFASQDVTFDESVCYYRSRPHRDTEVFPPPLFLTLEPPPVAPSSPPQPPVPVVSGGARGAVAEGEGTGAAKAGGVGSGAASPASPPSFPPVPQFPPRSSLRLVASEPGGVPPGDTGAPGGVGGGGAGSGGAGAGGTGTVVPTPRTVRFLTCQQRLLGLEREGRERFERAQQQQQSEQSQSHPFPRPSGLVVLPSIVLCLQSPIGLVASSLTVLHDPLSDYLRASRPVVSRVLSVLVTHPTAPLSIVSPLVPTVAVFASSHCLDYAAHLVSGPARSPSSGGAPVFPLEAVRAWFPRGRSEEAEMASYRSIGTYVDAVPPPGTKFVNGMWLYKVKRSPGSPPLFKARYVARGFSQCEEVDFFQTFAPTPKMTTLRGSLHEQIWLRRPPGFTGSFPAGTQWQLRRPVYGLRQAPREWHDTICTKLAALDFFPSSADPSLFVRCGLTLFFVLVYRYLGLQITRDRAARTITLTQSHMVEQILMRFRFPFSKVQLTPLGVDHGLTAPPSDEPFESSSPYPKLVGCLMYLMTCTRPDLAYPLTVLVRFVAPGRHRPSHWYDAKRVSNYVASTSGMGLVLGGKQPVTITGFSDLSWADDAESMRSTQGYCFSFGTGAVSWRSTWASSASSSNCEAEVSAVLLCEEPCLVGKAKHIQLRYFFLRELQQRGQALVRRVVSEANTADIFTKALPPSDHQHFCTQLGGTGGARAVGPGGLAGAGGAGGPAGGAGGAASAGGTRSATGAGDTGATSPAGPRGAGGAGGATSAGGTRDAGAGGARAAGAGGAGGAAGAGGAGATTAGSTGAASVGGPAGTVGTGPTGALRHLLGHPPAPTEFPVTGTTPPLLASVCTRVPRVRRSPTPAVPGTHNMTHRPSSVPKRVVMPSPPASSLPAVADPLSDLARASSPTVTRFLATVVTDPMLSSPAASALVAELVDFAAAYRLDYLASLVSDPDPAYPPSYVLIYINDFVFATADTEALALVKAELQERHTCNNVGDLRSYLGLQITRHRARRTITLTQSHMVHQVL